jgi:ABC-2 type transport system permease protein
VQCSRDELPRIVVDGSDPAAVRPAALALQAALLRTAAVNLLGRAPPKIDIDWLYNNGTQTSWSLAPGLSGVVVMISMLMLGALTVVGEREQGTWEGLLATPATAADALVGKLSPYVVIAVVQAASVVWSAHWLFEVPIRGDLAGLMCLSAVFAIAHLILGFALSSLAVTQLQAIQAAVFFYLPSMLLSGFMFPFSGMPVWAQSIGNVLPLTHFVRAARGVLLKGYGVADIAKEFRAIVAFALVAGAIAIFAYRRRLA